MCKLVGTQLSLFTTFPVLFVQFIFVLLATYVRMRNFTGKSKQMQAVYNSAVLENWKLEIFQNMKSAAESCRIQSNLMNDEELRSFNFSKLKYRMGGGTKFHSFLSLVFNSF